MRLRHCRLHIQLKTTSHIQWHKEPKLEEAPLAWGTSSVTPAKLVYEHSSSGPLVFTRKDTIPGRQQAPSICLCTGWKWGGRSTVKKGVWEIRGSQGKGGVQTGKNSWERQSPAQFYPQSTAASAEGSHFWLPRNRVLGTRSKEQSKHRCFARRAVRIPGISRWNPKYFEH